MRSTTQRIRNATSQHHQCYAEANARQISLLILIFIWPYLLVAQDRISFIDNDFSVALKLAEEQDKLVFIDGYATWCIPCKVMEEEVFVTPEVRSFFNEHFVNVKVDLEKGIGPILSARYQAQVLPAYFFITSDETLIYSFSGQQKIADLMQHAKAARNPDLVTEAWDTRYAEGDRKPSFLYKYAHAKYPSVDGLHQRLVTEYLATQDDWGSADNVRFIHHFIEVADSPMFDFMVKERGKFESVIPAVDVERTIDLLVQDAMYNRQPVLSMNEVGKLLVKSYPDNGKKRFLSYQIKQFRQNNEHEMLASTFVKYFKSYGADLQQDSLLNMANFILDSVTTPSSIREAYRWTSKISKQTRTARHSLLAGRLASKSGDHKAAIKLFKSSLKTAKKIDRDQTLVATCKTALLNAKADYRNKKKAA